MPRFTYCTLEAVKQEEEEHFQSRIPLETLVENLRPTVSFRILECAPALQ